MKKLLYITVAALTVFAALSPSKCAAQFDTTSIRRDTTRITMQITVRMMQYVLEEIEPTYSNAVDIDAMKVLTGNQSTDPDSVLVYRIRAMHLFDAVNRLITQPTVAGFRDHIKYVLNQRLNATGPAIVGYTALTTQINAKANNALDPEQAIARRLLRAYQRRVAELEQVVTDSKDNLRNKVDVILRSAVKQ